MSSCARAMHVAHTKDAAGKVDRRSSRGGHDRASGALARAEAGGGGGRDERPDEERKRGPEARDLLPRGVRGR